ncbi:Ras-related protein Rap-1 [Leucoagaricus sp. SymC.cos]|nr:Ras-related protein Rap-1 [Leucoagaricus sp. SymC.cos]
MQQFNVVVLGAGGVGKSALTGMSRVSSSEIFFIFLLAVRFIRDEFLEHYDPTIEEEYRRPLMVDGEVTSLEVLDTSGAEQFTSLHEVYIKSGLGFILVFSLTQETSLKEVDYLRKQIFRIKGNDATVPIVVAGTKLDLVNEREVQRNTIQSLASSWNLPFYETSAKRNWHVNDVFEDLVRKMRKRYPSIKKKNNRSCVIM